MEPFISVGEPLHNVLSGDLRSSGHKYQQKSKSKTPSKLHIGEILKGEILETHEYGIATVKLPIGILKAELAGNLHKGDELIFFVQQVEPSLILKIHSVAPTKSGKELDIREIIRILDLSDNNFFIKSIEFLKQRRQFINRDECISLFEMFGELEAIDYADISGTTLLATLLFFMDNKLDFSANSFQRIKYAFVSKDILEKILNTLKSKIENNTSQELFAIKSQLDSLSDGFAHQEFFLIKENTFALNIINLYKANQTQSGTIPAEIAKEITYLSKYINAIEIVRIVLLSNGKPYKLRIPHLVNSQICIAEVLCDIFGSPANYIMELTDNIKIRIELYDAKAENSKANIIVFAAAKDAKIDNYIEKMKIAFAPDAEQVNIEFRSLKLLNKYSEGESTSYKNVTFVV